jgi:hypothetical protein
VFFQCRWILTNSTIAYDRFTRVGSEFASVSRTLEALLIACKCPCSIKAYDAIGNVSLENRDSSQTQYSHAQLGL